MYLYLCIYKDRLYKMIFNDKSELKLYNAINGTHCDDQC